MPYARRNRIPRLIDNKAVQANFNLVEDFESGWAIGDIFIPIFDDNFDSGWSIDRAYNTLFVETFEENW